MRIVNLYHRGLVRIAMSQTSTGPKAMVGNVFTIAHILNPLW